METIRNRQSRRNDITEFSTTRYLKTGTECDKNKGFEAIDKLLFSLSLSLSLINSSNELVNFSINRLITTSYWHKCKQKR